jgi:hypothetical protein
MGTDGGVPVMRLPGWATPRTKEPVCECDLALPTVAHIHAEYRRLLPSGGRKASAKRFYEMIFEYDLCRVCVVFERGAADRHAPGGQGRTRAGSR